MYRRKTSSAYVPVMKSGQIYIELIIRPTDQKRGKKRYVSISYLWTIMLDHFKPKRSEMYKTIYIKYIKHTKYVKYIKFYIFHILYIFYIFYIIKYINYINI